MLQVQVQLEVANNVIQGPGKAGNGGLLPVCQSWLLKILSTSSLPFGRWPRGDLHFVNGEARPPCY